MTAIIRFGLDIYVCVLLFVFPLSKIIMVHHHGYLNLFY